MSKESLRLGWCVSVMFKAFVALNVTCVFKRVVFAWFAMDVIILCLLSHSQLNLVSSCIVVCL